MKKGQLSTMVHSFVCESEVGQLAITLSDDEDDVLCVVIQGTQTD